MYALNLAEDNRILSATFEEYATPEQPRVSELPEGDLNSYRYEAGAFIYDPPPIPTDNSEEIAALKAQLEATDYIVIKIAEGAATWDEYPGIKEQRQTWRDEINRLEAQEEAFYA